ncbi:MAG TPA: GAF domain-containing protein [Candidatus Acidoferrales bacterium]|nr:GAF domain-containing protein [Candidatus Acidoferrales bacterium]
MPIVMNNVLGQIRMTAAGADDRAVRAKRLAELVRKLGDYRWVGVYDVDAETVSIIGWNGPGAPAHPTFPASRGLTGAAIKERKAVNVGDVRSDPRYFPAFSDTISEIIVPVLDPSGERVIGTVAVESERANAFGPSDQRMIEQCAQAALPLWLIR